jgi:hypothetical protein
MKVLRKIIVGRARLPRTLYEHQRSGESKQTSGEGLQAKRDDVVPVDAEWRGAYPQGLSLCRNWERRRGKE